MTAGGAVVDLILCAGYWSNDGCRLQGLWRPQWDGHDTCNSIFSPLRIQSQQQQQQQQLLGGHLGGPPPQQQQQPPPPPPPSYPYRAAAAENGAAGMRVNYQSGIYGQQQFQNRSLVVPQMVNGGLSPRMNYDPSSSPMHAANGPGSPMRHHPASAADLMSPGRMNPATRLGSPNPMRRLPQQQQQQHQVQNCQMKEMT
jgi:hypothetical protein